MIDTPDTADQYGLANQPRDEAGKTGGCSGLYTRRVDLTLALNALNRGMGQPDASPFVLSPRALEKLQFVTRLVSGYRLDHGRRRDSRAGRPGSGVRMP